MKADYHLHCAYSDDSFTPMESMIKEAIKKGLDEMCFTDHVDYGVKVDHGTNEVSHTRRRFGCIKRNVDYPNYFKDLKRLQKKYKDVITIKQGLEFGTQTHTLDKYEHLYETYPMDFIILSIHQAHDIEFWGNAFKERSQKEYVEDYYDEMYKCIKAFKHYCVLGHLDYVNRYDPNGIYPFEKIKDKITLILKQVIEDGKGIEVNTSCFNYKQLNGDLTPSRDILKLYKELGGRIITIGSDAHQRQHIACNQEEVIRQLKELGFTKFCTYEKMKPIFHEL